VIRSGIVVSNLNSLLFTSVTVDDSDDEDDEEIDIVCVRD